VRALLLSLLIPSFWLLIPTVAIAQENETAIAGSVKDATGAALPGVTVEVSSPALIEKVRSVVSDGQGQYKIIDLRPGTYAVTFTLAGFNTIRREGIELTTNFTALVNAEMPVGSLQETITVTSAQPVVDVQNVVETTVFNKDTVNAIPNSRMMEEIVAMVPAVHIRDSYKSSGQDVGGTNSEGQQFSAVHGGIQNDQNGLIEGFSGNTLNSLASSGLYLDAGAIQEFSYELAAISPESATGGIRINAIPRDGGNSFTGSFYGAFTNHDLQAANLTDQLKAQGLTSVTHVDKIYDVNPGAGGPIIRDTLWFYASGRMWGVDEFPANSYFNSSSVWTLGSSVPPRYAADLGMPGVDDVPLWSASGRFTWQATPTNKLAAFILEAYRCECHRGVSATTAPEAAQYTDIKNDSLAALTWTSVVTSRLLLEAGLMPSFYHIENAPEPGLPFDALSITEKSTGFVYNASPSYAQQRSYAYNYKGSASYVTGSHAFKAGFTLQEGHFMTPSTANGNMDLALLNGVPNAVTLYTTPYAPTENLNENLGVYLLDKWTLRRLTLSGGLRLDHINESVPAQSFAATEFAPARSYAAIANVPNWYDISPRLGAAYDLFGNGRTALKASLSKYLAGETVGTAQALNPVLTSVNSVTRTWTDVSGLFNPLLDCNMTNPAANGGCGPTSNANFGKPGITTTYDPAVLNGWDKRGYNWETSAGIQQQLLTGMSLTATYVRREYGNFLANVNTAITASDYNPFCMTAPVNSLLPGGGGYQVCGLADLNPSVVGKVNNYMTFASNYGNESMYYNGVDVTTTFRRHGAQLDGGISFGHSVFDNCDVAGKVNNAAQALGFTTLFALQASPFLTTCHQATNPFLQPQIRFNGSFNLPWQDLRLSGTFQSLPGPNIIASWNAPSAVIEPFLGRNLSAGSTATLPIQLIQPGTEFEPRFYQVDMRLSKMFKVGRVRLNGNVDLYNMFNSNAVLALNTTYGPSFQQPTAILEGRLVKLGMTMDF
jgi:hypothetical protein